MTKLRLMVVKAGYYDPPLTPAKSSAANIEQSKIQPLATPTSVRPHPWQETVLPLRKKSALNIVVKCRDTGTAGYPVDGRRRACEIIPRAFNADQTNQSQPTQFGDAVA
jgi:hypothetical protein